jgi:hypothetical protein
MELPVATLFESQILPVFFLSNEGSSATITRYAVCLQLRCAELSSQLKCGLVAWSPIGAVSYSHLSPDTDSWENDLKDRKIKIQIKKTLTFEKGISVNKL